MKKKTDKQGSQDPLYDKVKIVEKKDFECGKAAGSRRLISTEQETR